MAGDLNLYDICIDDHRDDDMYDNDSEGAELKWDLVEEIFLPADIITDIENAATGRYDENVPYYRYSWVDPHVNVDKVVAEPLPRGYKIGSQDDGMFKTSYTIDNDNTLRLRVSKDMLTAEENALYQTPFDKYVEDRNKPKQITLNQKVSHNNFSPV